MGEAVLGRGRGRCCRLVPTSRWLEDIQQTLLNEATKQQQQKLLLKGEKRRFETKQESTRLKCAPKGNIVSETTNREEGRRNHGARDAGERWKDSTKRKASITADAERKQGTGNTRRRQIEGLDLIEAIAAIGHTAVRAF